MSNIRFNEVCVALENATPKRVAELVRELVSLTVNGMTEQPNPGLVNRACDATKFHSRWSKWVRAYMLEFMPFSVQASTGRFGGKMKPNWDASSCPEFSGWMESRKAEEKAAKDAAKEKAEAEKLAAQKQAELDAEAEAEAEDEENLCPIAELQQQFVHSANALAARVSEEDLSDLTVRLIKPELIIASLAKTMNRVQLISILKQIAGE